MLFLPESGERGEKLCTGPSDCNDITYWSRIKPIKIMIVVTVTVDCSVLDTILASPLWRMVMLSWVRSVKTRPKFLAAETSAFSSGD